MDKIPDIYSKDYKDMKMAIIAIPHYDIIIENNTLNIIKVPKTIGWRVILTIIGLVVFNLIGAIAGHLLGIYLEGEARKKSRLSWMSPEGKIISNKFEEYRVLEVSTSDFDKHISFNKGKLFFTKEDGKKIKLKQKKEEIARLKDFLTKK
ncbi:MAG: hypothetical protein ACJAV6_000233 [Candidatus Paceibacteria bacterium]|jgi:hypothetical protein